MKTYSQHALHAVERDQEIFSQADVRRRVASSNTSDFAVFLASRSQYGSKLSDVFWVERMAGHRRIRLRPVPELLVESMWDER